MFIRKNWLPLSVFLIVIVMVGLYVLQTRPEKTPIKIYKAVEVEKSNAEVPVGETSQGGHFHSDGTRHEGPHSDTLETSGEVDVPVPSREADQSGDARRGVASQQGTSDGSIPPAVKLDPETQKKVDALFSAAAALSDEADVWSAKLYAESQVLLKDSEDIKAEIAKRRAMRRDPNVDEETYKAFDVDLDEKVRALNQRFIESNEKYKENWERRDEAIRLRTEARRLQGLE